MKCVTFAPLIAVDGVWQKLEGNIWQTRLISHCNSFLYTYQPTKGLDP